MLSRVRLPRLTSARLILLISSGVILYLLLSAGLGAIHTQQLRHRESRLASEVQQMEERYRRLEALRDYLNSDEYIESVARQQLGLVRKGETGFVAISTQPSPAPGPGQTSDIWWENLIR